MIEIQEAAEVIVKPVINIAERGMAPQNPIRQRFAMQDLIDERLVAAGKEKTLKFSIGQPHLKGTPVYDSGSDKETPSGYTPSDGIPEVKKSIANLFNYRNPGLNATSENVLPTIGGTGALALTCSTLLEKGSKVLFPVPGFVAQISTIKTFGGQIVELDTSDNGYRINPTKLDELLAKNPDISFMVLNDPNNPTGVKYSESELRAIGNVLKKYPNVLIFSDETYHDLSFAENSSFLLQVNPFLKNRMIIEYSGAKDIAGRPGERFGMVYAPIVETIKDGKKIEVNLASCLAVQQNNLITSVPNSTQYKLKQIIDAKIDPANNNHQLQLAWESDIKAEYKNNIAIGRKALEAANLSLLAEPGGGFFLLAGAKDFIGKKIPNEITSKNGLKIDNLHELVGGPILDSDTKIINFFAWAANIMFVEASPFGGAKPEDAVFRISVATDAKNIEKIPEYINYARKLCNTEKVEDKSWAEKYEKNNQNAVGVSRG